MVGNVTRAETGRDCLLITAHLLGLLAVPVTAPLVLLLFPLRGATFAADWLVDRAIRVSLWFWTWVFTPIGE